MFSNISNLLSTYGALFWFWLHECIVNRFSLLDSGQVEKQMVTANHRVLTELLSWPPEQPMESHVSWSAVTSKHWFYFSSSVIVPWATVLTAHNQSLFSGGYNSTIKIPKYALVCNLVYRVPSPGMTVVYF